MKQSIGDRMKAYEQAYRQTLLPNAPYIARLDGRAFSNYTQKMKFKKPFDMIFVETMQEVTKSLMDKTQAILGYTQSDEITLVFKAENIVFNGRVDKICSTFASMATLLFTVKLTETIKKHIDDKETQEEMINNSLSFLPTFDCRVFSVPSKREALNAVVWREFDAVKNSIQMLAQSLFSHKSLQNLNSKQLQYKMLTEKEVNWNDLDLVLKRGTYFVRRKIEINVPEILQNKEEEKFKQIFEKYLKEIPLEYLKTLTMFERSVIMQDDSFKSMLNIFEDVENPEAYFGF